MAPSTTVSTWRDGRAVGRHIVDRALDYAALNRGGLTAAQIARRRKKSKGYVSIVLRLGTAIRGLDREEIAVFRSERITWKVAQKIVRAGVADAEIQRQLRYALGGFSTHNIDRRKLRKHRTKRTNGTIATGQPPIAESSHEPGVFVWRWDAEWATRDPQGYVDAYRAYLTSLHRDIHARFNEAFAIRAARTVPAAIPMVGQSLRQITALIARQHRADSTLADTQSATTQHSTHHPGLTSEERAALASITALDGILESRPVE